MRNCGVRVLLWEDQDNENERRFFQDALSQLMYAYL